MNNKFFVDTNVIIDLFNKKDKPHVNKLIQFMSDDNIELYINDFVMAEVLQGIKLQESNKYAQFKQYLENSFLIVDVDAKIILNSVEVYRTCKANGINFNNENICPVPNCNKIIYNSIDCIHYATCEQYELTMLTNDNVFNKIDQITTNNIVAAIDTHSI
jgi:predicted nucleic acid-binding protein